METIKENFHRNTTLGWAVATGTERAGCHISAGRKQFYLPDGEGGRMSTTNSCATVNVATRLCQGDLCGQL